MAASFSAKGLATPYMSTEPLEKHPLSRGTTKSTISWRARSAATLMYLSPLAHELNQLGQRS